MCNLAILVHLEWQPCHMASKEPSTAPQTLSSSAVGGSEPRQTLLVLPNAVDTRGGSLLGSHPSRDEGNHAAIDKQSPASIDKSNQQRGA